VKDESREWAQRARIPRSPRTTPHEILGTTIMNFAEPIPYDDRNALLLEALSDHRRATLTHRTSNGWRTHKATLVSGSHVTGSLVARVLDATEDVNPESLDIGQNWGVTFRDGHKKCMFSTVLQSVARHPDGLLVTLHWPEELQRLQRRAYERATPPRGTVVAVRFFREEPPGAARNVEHNVKHGQLEDLSAGGMRLRVADSQDVELDTEYRCIFAPRPGSRALVIDATLKHREAADRGRASLGFQFLGLEITPEGRTSLDRIVQMVSQFQQSRRSNARATVPRLTTPSDADHHDSDN